MARSVGGYSRVNVGGDGFFLARNIFSIPPTAPSDAPMGNNQMAIWLDEGNDLKYGFLTGVAP